MARYVVSLFANGCNEDGEFIYVDEECEITAHDVPEAKLVAALMWQEGGHSLDLISFKAVKVSK